MFQSGHTGPTTDHTPYNLRSLAERLFCLVNNSPFSFVIDLCKVLELLTFGLVFARKTRQRIARASFLSYIDHGFQHKPS